MLVAAVLSMKLVLNVEKKEALSVLKGCRYHKWKHRVNKWNAFCVDFIFLGITVPQN